VPESLLLWFHHVPVDHRMRSGRTLWDELVGRYSRVRQVQSMQATWAGLRDRIDPAAPAGGGVPADAARRSAMVA
jgi:alpha-glucuronidase